MHANMSHDRENQKEEKSLKEEKAQILSVR